MVDFGAEGLLDGLEGLSGTLAGGCSKSSSADGADLEELRTAVAEDTFFLLPAERMIGGATRYTRREIAEKTGLDLGFLEELRRAQGLPMAEEDARVLAETDLQAARTVRTLTDAGLRHEDILEVTRILGRGLSHAAEAMRRSTLASSSIPTLDEHELAMRYARPRRSRAARSRRCSARCSSCTCRHAVRQS